MLIATTTSSPAPRPAPRHEFAYPRVRQIAPRAHTVLASSLQPRRAGAPTVAR
jgi:hypothetical protein